jgi:hypothetical protein
LSACTASAHFGSSSIKGFAARNNRDLKMSLKTQRTTQIGVNVVGRHHPAAVGGRDGNPSIVIMMMALMD